VDTLDLLTEIGLGLLLIVIAVFLVWRLIDLFKKNGRWAKELAEADL
jgi:NhaP-type Na+/H+ or K+/H+ antiporter